VGDDLVEFEAPAEEEFLRLVPGLEHPASVDAEDGAALEDDVLVEVEGDLLGGR
jgi:hypothetical protein